MDDDIGLYDCPMPEPFGEKLGLTLFLAWLFYLGFVSRIIFGPLMPEIEADLGLDHLQAGYLFLMIGVGYLVAPAFSGLISARLHHQGALQLSAWLLGIALLPFAFVRSYQGMCVLMVIIGFAGFLHLPSAVATITAEIQKSDWSKGMAAHQCVPYCCTSAPVVFLASGAYLLGCGGIVLGPVIQPEKRRRSISREEFEPRKYEESGGLTVVLVGYHPAVVGNGR